jgi:7-cyano-7-deazaguanine synthase in queuosine biosynthesis
MALKNMFYGSKNKIMQFINTNPEAASLYELANSIFMLEKMIKAGNKIPHEVLINVYCDLDYDECKKITRLLNILVSDVLLEDVFFTIQNKKFEKSTITRNFKQCETLCLFSGGIDSTIGIIKSKEAYGDVKGIYVAHQDMGKITFKVDGVTKAILNPLGIEVDKLIAPAMGVGYSQTRGFLYLLYAGLISIYTEAKRVVVSECGATMYQPKFAPLDTITYTTNPYVLQIAKTIIQIILKKELEVVIPFEDFTKTELMAVLPDDFIFKKTHSCITSRWDKNCGACYACITRMIGSINLSLSLDYFKDNAFQKSTNEHLNALLNFCLNFLYNKQELDFWSFNCIEHFNKIKLFNRVCDDVFLAVYKAKNSGNLHTNYEFVLAEFLKLGKDRIRQRENELKNKLKLPDFNKTIPVYTS